MNAIDMLTSQHRDVDALFARLEAERVESRVHVFIELADLLAVHFKLEERVLYPAVCQRKTELLPGTSAEEHFRARQLLGELLELDAITDEWDRKIRRQLVCKSGAFDGLPYAIG